PSGQGHRRLHRRRAYPADPDRFAVSGAGLPAAGSAAGVLAGPVLLRRHLAADRGRGGDGLHRPDPGSPDVASVREPDEEGKSEGRFPRFHPRLRPPTMGDPRGGLARGWAPPGPALEERGRPGPRTGPGQEGSVAGAWAHSPCRVPRGCRPGGLQRNPEPEYNYRFTALT